MFWRAEAKMLSNVIVERVVIEAAKIQKTWR